MNRKLSLLAVGVAATAGLLAVATPASADVPQPSQRWFDTQSDCLNYGLSYGFEYGVSKITCSPVPVRDNGRTVGQVWYLTAS